MPNLNDQGRQAIEKAIFAGRKIEAIKRYRESTGEGLAEAKRAVEDMEVDLRRGSPEKFIASANKTGCSGVLVCAAFVVTGTILVSILILS